ncbi:DUF2771 domain-containing protein [Nocardia thailandica]|uniref:DUF2771 domain-containing protein n=1 Tax=Nocardia thailandica TaxID=257275 RepID=A0ABW6PJ41_9NOCA|nr:DUF2771 domain-containing protein [Nocardia thailandica]
MNKLNARTALILAAVALLVVAGATAAITAFAIHRAPERHPQITAYADGTTVTVDPFLYCTVRMEDCTYGETTPLTVRSGYPVQLSLPDKIADSPWLVQLIYQRPDGEQVDRILSFVDYPAARSLTIESQPEPDLRLAGIEVQLPILARDTTTGQETYIPHAAWSILTPR